MTEHPTTAGQLSRVQVPYRAPSKKDGLSRLFLMSEDYRKDVLAILADGFEPLYEFFYIIHFLNILNKYGIILLIISGI